MRSRVLARVWIVAGIATGAPMMGCGGGDADDGADEAVSVADSSAPGSTAATRRPQRPDPAGAIDRTIVPETRFGPVTAATSEADLISLLGAGAVEPRDASIGEGMCAPGSLLFGGTPDSAEVVWVDETRSRPAEARVRGPGYGWRTPVGIHVGMPLNLLVQANGSRPITFMGFGWDYGGSGSWTEPVNGRPATVGFSLRPDPAGLEAASGDPRFAETQGDREVSSDHPLVRLLRPTVAELRVRWDSPEVTRRCRR